MQDSQLTQLNSESAATAHSRFRWGAAYVAALTLCFAGSILDVVRLALADSAYSHLLLIPFITAGLLRQPVAGSPAAVRAAWLPAMGAGAVGLGLLGLSYCGEVLAAPPPDRLSLQIAAYLLLVWAGGFAVLGTSGMRRMVFAILFSLFFIPMPAAMVLGIESFLQEGSAGAANLMFLASRETFLRDDLVFRLPGLSVEVARECSGIRSTLVLIITGLLAAKVLLRTASRRVLLVALLLPIAILRNGFRVWLLATLSVHVDPAVIDSPLHRQGGPIFFALSLLVLFAVIALLMRGERRVALRATEPLQM